MAAGDIKWVYGAATEVAWASGGPQNLANATFSGLSDELDVDALDAVDLLVGVKFTPAAAPSAGGFVRVWVASAMDGANYPANAQNYLLVGAAVQAVNTSAHRSVQFSVAEAFGGVLPPKLKIAIENQTGVALSNVADANEAYYQAVHANVAP